MGGRGGGGGGSEKCLSACSDQRQTVGMTVEGCGTRQSCDLWA